MDDAKQNNGATRFKLTQPKQVIGFLCVFVLVYGLLMSPWPSLGAAYSRIYRAGAALLFESFGSKGVVRFEELSDEEYDTKIVFYSRDQVSPDGKMVPIGFMRHSSRRSAYIYAAFLTALILATPISWNRKGWALLWGMILVHGFIVFNLAIWILYGSVAFQLDSISFRPFFVCVIYLHLKHHLLH
jgi:hypothetical protein